MCAICQRRGSPQLTRLRSIGDRSARGIESGSTDTDDCGTSHSQSPPENVGTRHSDRRRRSCSDKYGSEGPDPVHGGVLLADGRSRTGMATTLHEVAETCSRRGRPSETGVSQAMDPELRLFNGHPCPIPDPIQGLTRYAHPIFAGGQPVDSASGSSQEEHR
jgi:hypothetical protein